MKTRTPFQYISLSHRFNDHGVRNVRHDSGYFSSPFFWGLILIAIILLLIMNSIGDLIENQNFTKLSEEEKAEYLKDKNTPYFQKLWNSAFKNSLLQKKKIF
jgi:cytochrome c oxidase cbb3-type subunit 3